MGTVHDIQESLPVWDSGIAQCRACGHSHIAVYHKDCDPKTLQCPRCLEMTSEVLGCQMRERGEH